MILPKRGKLWGKSSQTINHPTIFEKENIDYFSFLESWMNQKHLIHIPTSLTLRNRTNFLVNYWLVFDYLKTFLVNEFFSRWFQIVLCFWLSPNKSKTIALSIFELEMVRWRNSDCDMWTNGYNNIRFRDYLVAQAIHQKMVWLRTIKG